MTHLLKKNITSNHFLKLVFKLAFLKLVFKLAFLVSRRRHIIKKKKSSFYLKSLHFYIINYLYVI